MAILALSLGSTTQAPAATAATRTATASVVHSPGQAFQMPARLDARALAADRVTTAPDGARLAIPAVAGCSWYGVASGGWWGGEYLGPKNLFYTIEIDGLFNDRTGAYCGYAGDVDCAYPQNNSYYGGIVVIDWWNVNGVYATTIRHTFRPAAAHQTLCLRSGAIRASHSLTANALVADIQGNELGTAGLEARL